jgi:PAS domain S-box-containing protein/putative nucleotidyltransferase with HDIG domain
MWLYDLDTLQFIEVNQAAIAHYGYSREEFLGMRITDIRPPADVPLLLENVAAARPTLQQARRWRHLKKGGQVMEVQVTSHTLEFDGHRAALVVAEDITERKVAEELAQRQIARLAALRSIDVAITASLDLRGTLNVLLEQVTAQLGVHAADVLLLHPHSHVLEYAAGRGFLVTTRARTQVRVGEGYAGRAALERRIIGIPNINDVSSLAGQPILSHETFSAYYAVPLVAKGRVQGVLEVFHRAPLAPDADWLDFLEALAGQAAIAIDNAWLFDGLQRSNMELALAYDTTLEGWSRALDLRDKETEGHTQRVTEMTVEIARTMGMDEAELVHVRRGALLHDIGKMGIPDSILLKPGPLTDEEWVIMRQHPVYAYELLSPISFLRPALDIPYCHHEKWDGTGYPNGLKGTQIPLAARLFAVVDVWDALCSDRPYRPAWSEDKARDYLTDLAGVQFEAQAVDALFALV